MRFKLLKIVLALVTTVALAISAVTLAEIAGESNLEMSDSAGNLISDPDLSAVGGFSTAPGGEVTLRHQIRPPSMLTRQDYQDVYEEAKELLGIGVTFRTAEIQIVPSTTITQALQNYENFNDGEYFYRFCADYEQMDFQGYCPESDPSEWPDQEFNIRNKLIRARELFAFLSLAEPADTMIPLGGDAPAAPVRELGRRGVLTATREMANIHVIFGNEFLVDALDYRFSSSAPPSAQQIILQEIEQLEHALQQFSMAVDVMAHAFNADFGGPSGIYIGDYFTEEEFELFGIVSERMVMALDEIALRYRQLGQDEQAQQIYAIGAADQYVQALALANKAAAQDADFFAHGGWEMMANLGRLHAQVQAIHDGLNPFGFTEQYVPIHPYSDLFPLTQNQFVRDATEDEGAAREAQREFDHNATALHQELQNLLLTYDSQLLEMCGESTDDFLTCEGGLMEQNYHQMIQAETRIRLAQQRADSIPQRIANEQERAGHIINLVLENGQTMSAWDYTIALKSSYSEGRSHSVSVGTSFGVSCGFPSGCSASRSISRSVSTSKSRSWNPNAPEIAHLTSLKTIRQSAERAQIEGANSEAAIRNLLLEQADLMLERDLTIQEFNQLSAAHNHLVQKYRNLLNLRAQAQEDLLDSYLNNPAYRILRDTTTIEASRSHAIAAQFAYLTAKTLEYEFLQPVPFLSDVFKARTADDIDNFLLDLEQWRVSLGSPGLLNRYPYEISIAQDLLGLSDENLDPDGSMSSYQRSQLRYQLFQEFLQDHVYTDTVKFQFTTSVQDNNIFSQNIWNNRIAGVALPAGVPNTEGLAMNILTRQFGNVGTPEVILTHGGQASYRNVEAEITEYNTGPARLVGYPVPPGFQNENTTAVILSSVNGNENGTPTSALFNLSVAASNWTLKIDLTSPFNDELDTTQIEDLVILLDSTAIALPNLQMSVIEEESEKLSEQFEKAKKRGVTK